MEAKEEEAKEAGKQATEEEKGEEAGEEKAEKEAGEEAGKEVAGKEAGKGLAPKQRRQRQQKQHQKQHAAAGGVKVKAFEAALKRRAQKGEVSLLKKHRPPQKGKGKPRRPQGKHRAEEEDDGLELGAVGAVGEFEEQEGMDPGLDEEMDGEVDAV